MSHNASSQDRLKVNLKGVYFGYIKLFSLLFLLVLLIGLIQIIVNAILYPNAKKLSNLIRVYGAANNGYNAYFTAHVGFQNTIL